MDNAANEQDEKPEVTPAEPALAATGETPAGETPAVETVTAGLEIGSQPAEPAVRLPHTVRGKIEPDGTAVSTGRRKTAVARVRIRKGAGKFTINGRAFEVYFPVERHRLMIEAPLKATGTDG